MSISTRVKIMLVAFAIIPTMLFSVVSLQTKTSIIEKLQFDRLNTTAKTSADAFSEIINIHKQEVLTLAKSWWVKDYLTSVSSEKVGIVNDNYQALFSYMSQHIKNKAVENIVLLDSKGKVVLDCSDTISDTDMSKQPYFTSVQNVSNSEYVFCSDVLPVMHGNEEQEDQAKLVCAFSKPIWNDAGKLDCVLVALINVHQLSIFLKGMFFDETGLSFIIDSNNFILYHSEPQFYNTYTTAPKLDSLVDRWNLGEIPESGMVFDEMNGIKRIYYYVIMKDLNFAFVLRQDYSEYVYEIKKQIEITLVSLMLVIIAAMVAGVIFSKRLMNPINKIRNAFASGLEKDDYTVCEILSNDEFGEIAANYNTMITNIKSQLQLTLEEKDKNYFAATHDRLTGLFNRQAFEINLAKHLTDSCGILFIDVDSFKKLNEIHGMTAGDFVLKTVAQRIKNSNANFDVIAHAGGDKFIIAIKGDEKLIAEAVTVLQQELAAPIISGEDLLLVSVCVGIAIYPQHGLSVESLITNADLAMLRAVQHGKGTVNYYSSKMRDELDRNAEIKYLLQNAIENNNVFLMYQPVFNAEQTLIGYESLMRVRSKQTGLISPLEFIPIARQDQELLGKLENWAINAAASVAQKQKQKGLKEFVAVNISSEQIKYESFVEYVNETVSKFGLEYGDIMLEFSEQILMLPNIIENLQQLSRTVLISLNTYTMQSTSLSYYLQFPLTYIKCEREFFLNSTHINKVEIINKAIIRMTHELGVKLIAVGVENQNECDELKILGYDALQGFFLGFPKLLEEL